MKVEQRPSWTANCPTALALLIAFACICRASATTSHYKIGILYPLASTDPNFNTYGEELNDIADMVVAMVNNRSSALINSLMVSNITLEAIRRDEASDQQTALFSAISFHTDDNIDVVIGADWSAASMITNFYLSKVGVVQISASSTSTALQDRSLYPTFMRTVPSDALQGKALAYVVRSFGWDNVATIGADDDYAKPLIAKFREAAEGLNVTVVQSQQVSRTADPTAQVLAIKASGAKIILVVCFMELAKAILDEFAAQGMATSEYVYIGTDGWIYRTVFAEIGLVDFQGAILGTLPFFGSGPSLERMLDEMTAFKATHPQQMQQFDPAARELYSPFQPYMYDAVVTVAAALSKFRHANKTLPADFADLYTLMNSVAFEGTTGAVKFSDGERLGQYAIINHPPGLNGMVTVGNYDAVDSNRVSLDANTRIVWGQGSTRVPTDAICVPACSAHGVCTKVLRVGVCQCSPDWQGLTCAEAASSSSSTNIARIVGPVVSVTGAVIVAVVIAFFIVLGQKKMAIKVGTRQRRHVIDFAEIVVLDRIGIGAYGEVFRGTFRNTEVAIKKIRWDVVTEEQERRKSNARKGSIVRTMQAQLSMLSSKESASSTTPQQAFLAEIDVMCSLRHPNVLLFMGSCEEPMALITEYMANGSLRDLLIERQVNLKFAVKLRMLADAARGMVYLHEAGLLHGDLKTANLLLDQNMVLKVADFGLSLLKNRAAGTEQLGTYLYMAPEVYRVCGPYVPASDVFSFAIIMWETFYACPPYEDVVVGEGIEAEELARRVADGELRLSFGEDCSVPFAVLTKACWDHISERRPSFSQVLVNLDNIAKSMAAGDEAFLARRSKSNGALLGAGDDGQADGTGLRLQTKCECKVFECGGSNLGPLLSADFVPCFVSIEEGDFSISPVDSSQDCKIVDDEVLRISLSSLVGPLSACGSDAFTMSLVVLNKYFITVKFDNVVDTMSWYEALQRTLGR